MIKPSQLQDWKDIDQSKADTNHTAGRPELYGWFKSKGGVFYPHRKPTISETLNNEFH
jgi:hypothetical protein